MRDILEDRRTPPPHPPPQVLVVNFCAVTANQTVKNQIEATSWQMFCDVFMSAVSLSIEQCACCGSHYDSMPLVFRRRILISHDTFPSPSPCAHGLQPSPGSTLYDTMTPQCSNTKKSWGGGRGYR